MRTLRFAAATAALLASAALPALAYAQAAPSAPAHAAASLAFFGVFLRLLSRILFIGSLSQVPQRRDAPLRAIRRRNTFGVCPVGAREGAGRGGTGLRPGPPRPPPPPTILSPKP